MDSIVAEFLEVLHNLQVKFEYGHSTDSIELLMLTFTSLQVDDNMAADRFRAAVAPVVGAAWDPSSATETEHLCAITEDVVVVMWR